ncbi:MAG: hypothetical protein V3V19_11135 [Cocleimonas sp.]
MRRTEFIPGKPILFFHLEKMKADIKMKWKSLEGYLAYRTIDAWICDKNNCIQDLFPTELRISKNDLETIISKLSGSVDSE